MDKISVPKCPQCGRQMLKRARRSDGQPFWGCSGFPKCREILPWQEEVTRVADEKEVQLSTYQQNLVDAIRDKSGGNLVVEAVAGSGKTFIIVYSLRFTHGDVTFLAFNKAIATTLKRKAPGHVNCSTIHSLGFSAINKAFPYRPEVDERKKLGIAKEMFPDDKDAALRNGLVNLASKCQNTLTDPSDIYAVSDLIDRYSIDFNGNEESVNNEARAISALPHLLKECQSRKTVVDYDDMIWLPIVLNLPIPKHDWVFVDEAQDLNASNLALILRAVKSNGRVVVVGDRNQSIYGFRGADTNAIPNLIEGLQAKVMPLSITYRCPISHVKLARQLVPQLESAPWAEEGEIIENLPKDRATAIMIDGDLIMCRTNAPLISLCYELIKMGKKATIQGRDIGQGLIQMIDKLKPKDIDDLLEKLETYRYREMAKLAKSGREHSIQALEDKCDCIFALTEGMDNLSELRARIENIFTDNQTGIILSSVHRAKGLEADHTFILRPDLMPFPKATKQEDIQQEYNIMYVALTRAKKSMVFIDGPAPVKNEYVPPITEDQIWSNVDMTDMNPDMKERK